MSEGPEFNGQEVIAIKVNKLAFQKMLAARDQHKEFNTNRTRRELVQALTLVLLNAEPNKV